MCKKVGHRAPECPSNQKPTSKQKPLNKQKPGGKGNSINKPIISHMAAQELEQKRPCTKESHAKEPFIEESLIVSSFSLPGNFFAEEDLVAPCKLGNSSEIKTTALLNTGATRYLFVDPSMARRICDDLMIKLIRLSKPKAIRGFDGKQAPSVTHAIYPTMTIQAHTKTTTPMLITKLGQHQIILGKPWMRKHGAVLDMRTNQLSFWPGHYQHDVALKPCAAGPQAGHKEAEPHAENSRVEKPRAAEPQKTILKQTSNELSELLPHLLPSTQGVSKIVDTSKTIEPKKKKKKPSTTSRKLESNAKDKPSIKKETEEKRQSVEQADKSLDLTFIGGAPFMHLAKEKAEIFAISMRDIEYQLNKETKPLTDPKTVVLAEYHDFLDVFSKEVSDTLRPYGKYDHKIELLKDKQLSNLGHSML